MVQSAIKLFHPCLKGSNPAPLLAASKLLVTGRRAFILTTSLLTGGTGRQLAITLAQGSVRGGCDVGIHEGVGGGGQLTLTLATRPVVIHEARVNNDALDQYGKRLLTS